MFNEFKYPGHLTTIRLGILCSIMMSMIVVLDRAYMAAFGIVPIICFQMWLREGGLLWSSDKKGVLFTWLVCIVWYLSVLAVRVQQLFT